MSKRINLNQSDKNEINFKSYRYNPHQRQNPLTVANDSDLDVGNEMEVTSETFHSENIPDHLLIPTESFNNDSHSNSCMSSNSFFACTVNTEM